MVSDSINDEIRIIRRNLASQFGNDLDLILADIRRRESSDGRTYVTLPPRAVLQQPDERSETPIQSVERVSNGSPNPAVE